MATATAVRVRTTVLPGHRVQFVAPELTEGTEVEVIALAPEPTVQAPRLPLAELLRSFPHRQLTAEEWAERDREFQEDRDSWDR
jgi:hypothetical protein